MKFVKTEKITLKTTQKRHILRPAMNQAAARPHGQEESPGSAGHDAG